MPKPLVDKDSGQAFVEYIIFYPGVILLAIFILYILGPSISDIYRHVVRVITRQKPCVTFNGAEDNEFCDHHEDCLKTEYSGEINGSFVYDGELSIEAVVIKAGLTYEVSRNDPYQLDITTDDGCYKVTFMTNRVDWQRISSGSECQAVSHIDYWSAPLCE
jgi:hypothetical protein